MAILSVFLSSSFSEYDYEAPLEKWTAILRLAHMWQFPKVKSLAMRKMDKLDIEPVVKAVIARDYQVDKAFGWLEQAYATIGVREESISKAEAERLGLGVVVRLAELRERIRKRKFEKEKNALQFGLAELPKSPRSPMYSLEYRGRSPKRSPSPSLYEPRSRSRTRSFVGIPVGERPAPLPHPMLQKPAAGYTEEDLADVRLLFGI